MNMGQGGAGFRVPVRYCMECNTNTMHNMMHTQHDMMHTQCTTQCMHMQHGIHHPRCWRAAPPTACVHHVVLYMHCGMRASCCVGIVSCVVQALHCMGIASHCACIISCIALGKITTPENVNWSEPSLVQKSQHNLEIFCLYS